MATTLSVLDRSHCWIRAALVLALGVSICACGEPSLQAATPLARSMFCSATAGELFDACKGEAKDDLHVARAICINLSDSAERDACLAEAEMEQMDSVDLCKEQRTAREALCVAVGEDRYEPDFDPALFDSDFGNLTNPNPYFPLSIGNHWVYAGGDETIVIDVLGKTKRIEGVTCVVVRDRVEVDGEVVEDTFDWFGQRLNGTVDYCGEISQNFELFDGDDPAEPELVDVDGSWKAGRDGALPGTLFLGAPVTGAVYRQEFSPNDAEDAAEVLSTTYGYGNDAELDQFVPPALAALLCSDDNCVVTGEFSPLSPDAFERKYYAQGIGLFLEVSPESGEIVQLVNCSFDTRCNALPPAP